MSDTVARPRGTMRLFTFRGIPVYLHWSWGLIGLLELQWRSGVYGSPLWNLAEYIGLFGLVVLHEFGHAFACRSVGGSATHILLWPLGGVAYVRPPPRPGALLWSIAAGPLVNLALVPVALGAMMALGVLAPGLLPDLEQALWILALINVALFVFNVLPIYPLDGGQMVHALLWFVLGRDRSLLVTAGFGLVVSVVGGLAAWFWLGLWWLALIALYAAWRSWAGVRIARLRLAVAASPRHAHARCSACGASPPAGAWWRCENGHRFDPFENDGACAECDAVAEDIPCAFCGTAEPVDAYTQAAAAQP